MKFAIIGSGFIGKRHAEMIRRNPEAELVAMCDVIPKDKAAVGDFNVPYFTSVEEMFRSGIDFDVVNICTPNGLHAEHAIKALDNRKHVVCEKPMALTLADADAMIAACRAAHVLLGVALQRRTEPDFAAVRAAIEAGVNSRVKRLPRSP